MRETENRFTLVIVSTFPALAFGYWMNSFWAGAFMFGVILCLGIIKTIE